jgi:hypothetical protein
MEFEKELLCSFVSTPTLKIERTRRENVQLEIEKVSKKVELFQPPPTSWISRKLSCA